jgi:hypothetical protein
MSKREAGKYFPRAARCVQPRKIFRKTRPDGREDSAAVFGADDREDFPAACQC